MVNWYSRICKDK